MLEHVQGVLLLWYQLVLLLLLVQAVLLLRQHVYSCVCAGAFELLCRHNHFVWDCMSSDGVSSTPCCSTAEAAVAPAAAVQASCQLLSSLWSALSNN